MNNPHAVMQTEKFGMQLGVPSVGKLISEMKSRKHLRGRYPSGEEQTYVLLTSRK
jgi:hypothetical protein